MAASFIAALSVGVFVCLCSRLIVKPLPRFASRIHPYSRAGASDIANFSPKPGKLTDSDSWRVRIGQALTARLSGLAGFGDSELALKLRQAGLFRTTPAAFRTRIVFKALVTGGATLVVGLSVGLPILGALIAALLFIASGARQKGSLEGRIRSRDERIRYELFTVNQILAIQIRTGAGPVQAIKTMCEKMNGPVAQDFNNVLNNIRNGMSPKDAFESQATGSSEPNERRTLHLFATSSIHGTDLAESLLDLSKDLRDERREDLRKNATKRRTAMLIPTIAVLAPIMLLFIGAPIPSIVFGYF